MKITELKANQVVHCTTHEEAERVLKLADEAGMEWRAGNSYIEDDNWELYEKDTCYNFDRGGYCFLDHYEKKGYEIIPSEKITDNKTVMENMKNKTEFFEERVMEVSGDGIKWKQRVVFGKKNGKYIAWDGADTVEEAEKITGIFTWNYAREIDPFRELKEAWERGEDIQCYNDLCEEWVDVADPAWSPSFEYRIKPKSKYVPFTYEDRKELLGKVVFCKDCDTVSIITTMSSDTVRADYDVKYEELLSDYTFLDGSPCGKEVKE